MDKRKRNLPANLKDFNGFLVEELRDNQMIFDVEIPTYLIRRGRTSRPIASSDSRAMSRNVDNIASGKTKVDMSK